MAKKYRLLKDLPDGSKVGDTYQQFNISKKYYNVRLYEEATAYFEGYNWETWQVENNPTWFEEIKEKEKRTVWYMAQTHLGRGDSEVYYVEIGGGELSKDQIEKCKQAIEKVLNDDSVFDADRINNQFEKLKSMEDAFNAARLTHPFGVMKFDSFNDYLKSIE
ncbi:MAG TPA: hypothetical protein PKV73_01240 [Agriterribacter sp.]|nr:hypothetical protein [Agriterribacter sp.]